MKNPKTNNYKYPVKWSADRDATRARQQEIANEVKETIIEEIIIAINAKRGR